MCVGQCGVHVCKYVELCKYMCLYIRGHECTSAYTSTYLYIYRYLARKVAPAWAHSMNNAPGMRLGNLPCELKMPKHACPRREPNQSNQLVCWVGEVEGGGAVRRGYLLLANFCTVTRSLQFTSSIWRCDNVCEQWQQVMSVHAKKIPCTALYFFTDKPLNEIILIFNIPFWLNSTDK